MRPYAVAITDVPLFVRKSELFRGSHFLIGMDTFKRVVDPKYYAPPSSLEESLRRIQENDCTFVVGCRLNQNTGEVETLEQFDSIIPKNFRASLWGCLRTSLGTMTYLPRRYGGWRSGRVSDTGVASV